MPTITGAVWEQIRPLIEKKAGTIRGVKPVKNCTDSSFAAIVQTEQEPIFVKGRRRDDPQARTLARECAINQAVRHVSPWLRWSASDKEWDLLGFEHINGWHVNFKPGSPDLPKVVRTLFELQRAECPSDIELMQAEQRWYGFTDTPELFAGGHLLHTDLSPSNVLINGRAYLVDWGWPTRGAAWIDPACWVVSLIAAGHTPLSAEKWAERVPSWNEASPAALKAFAHVQAAIWNDIAAGFTDEWIKNLAKAAWLWARYRDIESRKRHEEPSRISVSKQATNES